MTRDQVSFYADRDDDGRVGVAPAVNGRPLADLAEDYETQREFDPAGGYGGLFPSGGVFSELGTYLLGGSDQTIRLDDHIYLLGCSCGEEGCWPLVAHVAAGDDIVIWSDFANPHRPDRDYTGLGPFRFARSQYDSALGSIPALLSSPGS